MALLNLVAGAAGALFGAPRAPPARMCEPPPLPRPLLCVLDLDMCVWRPEMYELHGEVRPRHPTRTQAVTPLRRRAQSCLSSVTRSWATSAAVGTAWSAR